MTREEGFTLVELIVTLAVTLVVFAATLTALGAFSRGNQKAGHQPCQPHRGTAAPAVLVLHHIHAADRKRRGEPLSEPQPEIPSPRSTAHDGRLAAQREQTANRELYSYAGQLARVSQRLRIARPRRTFPHVQVVPGRQSAPEHLRDVRNGRTRKRRTHVQARSHRSGCPHELGQ